MEMRAIMVHDGGKYFYTTSSYIAANPLGVVKATLTEYALFNSDNREVPIGKLYKTDEGNWYDGPGNNLMSTNLATFLKMAIDKTEAVTTAGP